MILLTDDMRRMVREQRLGYVATVSPDGTPSISPKGSLRVWDDQTLVWADIDSPRSVSNLAANPSTEINVVDPFVRKGYRFIGKARLVREGPVYEKALAMYKDEGGDIQRIRVIVLVNVTATSPLTSPVYLQRVNEEDVRALWEEWHRKSAKRLVVDLVPPNDF